MSQRQLAIRAAALLSATAGALAPVADLAAKRRRRRRDNDDDDDDKLTDRRRRRDREDDDDDGGDRFRLNRKSRRSDDDKDNDDEPSRRSSRQNNRSDDSTDEDDGGGGRESGASGQQSILGDLDLQGIIEERVSTALARGGGGGDDEPNITVSEDGESLVVLTDNIEFAGDEFGFEVETDGISYSSGGAAAGGDIDQDFTS